MKRLQFVLLLLILFGAFTVRLYRFDSPIADWHSWRQSDTSAVSRNFVKNGFDILHPKFDDLSNVPSGFDNPNGYRFVEFPIYNVSQAGLYSIFGIFTIEQWGRLVTIFSSVLSTLFIYLLVKKYKSGIAGLMAAFFFAFLPFNIYFGRVILPDPMMVTSILGGIYFFDKWIENSKLKTQNSLRRQSYGASATKLQLKTQIFFILSILLISASFLLKPYALFFTLPIIYIAFRNFGIKTVINWKLWLFAVFTLAPLVFWRDWIQQYPEGIPVSDWLFNGGNIRFKPSFFYWIFADRIGRLILGYWGIALFILGILSLGSKIKNETNVISNKVRDLNFFCKTMRFLVPPCGTRNDSSYGFFLSFLFSSLLYLFVMARGNVQHDYYQILIIPSLAIFLGLGSEFLLMYTKEHFNRIATYSVFMLCFSFMFLFSWYFVRDFFNINNRSIVIAGEAVDKLIPKDAKIVVPYDGDTSFLYQTKRQGWASFQRPLAEMVEEMGATHLVFVNTKESDYNLGKEYKIMSATKDYILFDLRQKP